MVLTRIKEHGMITTLGQQSFNQGKNCISQKDEQNSKRHNLYLINSFYPSFEFWLSNLDEIHYFVCGHLNVDILSCSLWHTYWQNIKLNFWYPSLSVPFLKYPFLNRSLVLVIIYLRFEVGGRQLLFTSGDEDLKNLLLSIYPPVSGYFPLSVPPLSAYPPQSAYFPLSASQPLWVVRLGSARPRGSCTFRPPGSRDILYICKTKIIIHSPSPRKVFSVFGDFYN